MSITLVYLSNNHCLKLFLKNVSKEMARVGEKSLEIIPCNISSFVGQ